MRIIGKTDNGFILEASGSELEQLDDKYYGHGRYGIGSEITVNAMYDQVKFLNRHHSEIEVAKKSLSRIIDNLELIDPFVSPTDEGAK